MLFEFDERSGIVSVTLTGVAMTTKQWNALISSNGEQRSLDCVM